MDSLIQLSQQMNWPFTCMMIGVAFAVGMVRVSHNARATRKIDADAGVEKARISVGVKNGLVPRE